MDLSKHLESSGEAKPKSGHPLSPSLLKPMFMQWEMQKLEPRHYIRRHSELTSYVDSL